MDSFVGRDDAIFYSWILFFGDDILGHSVQLRGNMLSEPRLMMSDHALSPNIARYAIDSSAPPPRQIQKMAVMLCRTTSSCLAVVVVVMLVVAKVAHTRRDVVRKGRRLPKGARLFEGDIIIKSDSDRCRMSQMGYN